jgi:spermidine/putrescine transport system permease protein
MKKNYGPVYTFPFGFWLFIFFVIPTVNVFLYSFMKKALRGGVIHTFTLEAYRAILQPAFLRVVGLTLWISLAATVVSILIAVPAGYYIARSRHRNTLLLFVIVPFWTNLLVRIFAWIAILGNNGFLNRTLLYFGIIDSPLQFLYNSTAIIVVTVYTSLPYAILPLYSVIEKFDFSLLEAARDLGATKMQSIFRVFLPNIKPGIITAVIFVFIPALGSYAVPQLVGGLNSYMVGNLIARELTVNNNWPLASSMSVLLTLVTTAAIIVFMRMNREQPDRKSQARPDGRGTAR